MGLVYLTLVYSVVLIVVLMIWVFATSCKRDETTPEETPTQGAAARDTRVSDRQNTVELGRQHSRYGDIFYIEPNSQEAARIREQLEKDEKDLPSYEEVMRMCNLTTPTAAVAPPPTQPPMMESNAIGIAALPAPPYSEIDPHRSVTTPPPPIATGTTVNTSEPSPSTSRAAQITT
ncbi:hypothetical protein AWZ03_003432 [Drosophila navojoa]|uniref:Uncharacterized protein n=1 Tax=Drosophila navojoa TaxID=7232 RepID=A0A484BMX3_DRONA|nr:uncharacterized protein LOC108653931 isoform X7 [Drosophila navojoa]TDG50216.1 hypothetical protein AWZ03_003432 [Drosophila navojoa]